MLTKIKNIYHEYSPKFWLVVGVSFIDGIGGKMLFPFFSLYITWKFDVGMTQAGIVLGIFSAFGLLGNFIGGALTDKLGRRKLIIFGLIFSAFSTLALGLVDELKALYSLAVVVGLFSNIAGPAHQAMIADILPEKQRAEGFGVLRVVGNLTWIIGPSIGGFVANRSYFALFVTDAVVSSIVAILFYFLISETKPEASIDAKAESMFQTFIGYFAVLKNFAFMAFIATSILMGMVYLQMYNSLSVYLRDHHSIGTQGYGFLMSTSAITVILLQFWTTRRIKFRPPFMMMAFGAFLYGIGFTMFGFDPLSVFSNTLQLFIWEVSLRGTYIWFMGAVFIITIGEMLIMPVSQALAANFAPEDMRGRYMAIFSLAWAIPATFGPWLAGQILDNKSYNPNILWYLGGIICLVSVMGFCALHLKLGGQKRFAATPASVQSGAESLD
ncbi:MAG: MFS transporter [Chloroflexi bacterium]|nr:MFS transporter [Chloroflexota bacterium]